MASFRSSNPLELEITISSAKDLKNVNWRHGDLKPYAVVWVDPKSNSKSPTKVDEYGDTCPTWDETLTVPLTSRLEDSLLSIDILHAYAAEGTKQLIGSTRIPIKDIVDDVGFGEWAHRDLKLKRPSGRPHGRLQIKILVRETRYRGPDPYYAPPYGVPPPAAPQYSYSDRDPYGGAAPPSGYPYNPPRYAQEPYVAAPSGYPYNPPGYAQETYGAPPNYGQGAYGAPSGYVGGGQEVQQKKTGSKFGIGTGLAVGAVAGVLGGLVLKEGFDHVENKIADNVEDRVEDDAGYDDEDQY